MMEGVSSEAASLGRPSEARTICAGFTTTTASPSKAIPRWPSPKTWPRALPGLRLECAAGRRCQRPRGIEGAFSTSKTTKDRPTLVIVESHIGYGSPNRQDTSAAHGEPLGEEEIKLTKRAYGWPEDAKFLVPDGVYDHFQEGIGSAG